jgi:hypothetical protein
MELRGNLLSVAVVAFATGVVALSFPFDAVSFKPSRQKAQGDAFAAFVSLDGREEAAAMKAAKSSWNAESGGVRHMRAELFFSELPEVESEPALRLSDRFALSSPDPVAPGLSPYLPSMAAPPPRAIPAEKAGSPAVQPAAFSREDLLKME